MTAAGVPDQIVQGFAQAGGNLDLNTLTGTGQGFDLGAAILAGIPEAVRPTVEPFISDIIQGLHAAFSLATAQTFWLGVVGAIIATIAAVAIKEIPLRTSNEAPVPTRAVADVPAPTGAPDPVSASTARTGSSAARTTD
jgi:hypothetical protein